MKHNNRKHYQNKTIVHIHENLSIRFSMTKKNDESNQIKSNQIKRLLSTNKHTKQAFVPRSLLHCSSNESIDPGNTLGNN